MKKVIINRKWCKQCGICIAFCPKNVFESDDEKNPVPVHEDACIGCRLCEKRCPELAIEVEDRK